MSKFKIGDTVKVLDEGNTFTRYDEFILPRLGSYKALWIKGYSPRNGDVGKITAVDKHLTSEEMLHIVKTDTHVFCMGERGLKLIKPTAHPTIIIHTDGITTTALLKEGKKVVKQAHAVCSPSDTYDHEYGVRLALDRLFGHEVKAVPPSVEDEDKAICEQLMKMAKDRGLSGLSISASPECSTCHEYYSVMEHRTGKGVTRSKTYHPEETE